MNAERAQGLPTQVLHSMTRDKASRFHTFRWEKRAGEGMGGLGGRLARTPFLPSLRKDWALSRWRDRKAARRAVPVRRHRSLTGIDSDARGSPLPPNRQRTALTGSHGEGETFFIRQTGSALPRASSPSAVPSSSRHHQRARRQSRSMSPPAATLSICRYWRTASWL